MTRLILGVLLWSIVHFIPAIVADLKKTLINRFGEYPYKGVFTLVMVVAIYLIISGWKSVSPDLLYYTPPDWGGHAAILFILVGFILFLAPYPVNNFKTIMRHPQLIGMAFWGVGHLLSNGEVRSVILFGGLTAWAVIEMLLINRRDGEWTKPARVSGRKDLTLVLFGALVYMVFLYTHHLLFGGSPLI